VTAVETERMTERTKELDFGRMAKAVADARKDGLLVDFSRLICVHYARMVEHVSGLNGNRVASHNNKTLFLEAIDLWCRARLSGMPMGLGRRGPASGSTEDPAEVVEHAMRPYYEAMAMDDPSRYRIGRREPPPLYTGSPIDALCLELGLCACLDVTPIHFKVGLRDGKPERVWGRVQADEKWYDTDPSEPDFVLGDHAKYPEYQEMEAM
jgi:hypothetical protein